MLSGDGWFLEKIVVRSKTYSSMEDLVFRCQR